MAEKEIRILHMLNGAKEAEGIAVIIDVFRAMTVQAVLAQNGAAEVYAVGDQDIAYEAKRKDRNTILIGERGGVMLPGFDHGNSPSEIENVDFRGKTVYHTTSAGTQGLAAAENADEIIAGSLVCAKAIAEYLRCSDAKVISLVAMGLAAKTRTAEDELCARYIKSLVEGNPIETAEEIDDLKRTDGAKFFDPSRQHIFPERDFWMSTECGRYPFIIRADRIGGGVYRMIREDIL